MQPVMQAQGYFRKVLLGNPNAFGTPDPCASPDIINEMSSAQQNYTKQNGASRPARILWRRASRIILIEQRHRSTWTTQVTLEKQSESDSFGIETILRAEKEGLLLLFTPSKGLAGVHNDRCQKSSRILRRDTIVDINGSEDPTRMMAIIYSTSKLVMKIKKPAFHQLVHSVLTDFLEQKALAEEILEIDSTDSEAREILSLPSGSDNEAEDHAESRARRRESEPKTALELQFLQAQKERSSRSDSSCFACVRREKDLPENCFGPRETKTHAGRRRWV